MPNFYCSHCGQPIQAQEEAVGMNVGCPACRRSVRVPGQPRPAAPAASRIWLWIGLAVLLVVMLTAAQILMAAQPAAAGADSPEMASFLARTLSTLAIVGVPALLLAAVGVSLGLLTNPPVSRLTGLVFSILLLPLTVFVLFGDNLTGGRHMQNLIRLVETKADAMPRDLAGLFNRSSSSPPPPTIEQMQEAVAGIREDTEKMRAQMDEDGVFKTKDLPFSPLPEPTNDGERLRAFMQAYMQDLADLQNDYMQELQAAGGQTALEPERLLADTDFSQSARIVTELRQIVQKYKARSDSLINGIPERIAKTDFSPSMKAGLMEGVNSGMGKSLPLLKENWEIEAGFIEVVADILDHLKSTHPHWTIDDSGQLSFEDQKEADHYNLLIEKSDQLARRQAEIRQQTTQSSKERMQNLFK